MENPFIKEGNTRERKEDMWGYDSLKGKANNLTHFINRKESSLKIIISSYASHKIFGGKDIMKVQTRLKKKNEQQKIPS